MTNLHSAELSQDHLEDGEPETLIWLRNSGYPVNLEALHPVVSEKPGTDNTGYLVHEITTYCKPPETADAIEDTVTVYVCHCSDFVYRKVPDMEEHTPDEIGACKHCLEVDKSLKAQADPGQGTLEVDG